MRKNTESTKKTEQLLLRPREVLIERLMAATEEYGRGKSHNQVAIEVLEEYLDFWVDAEIVRAQHQEEQRASALGKAQAPATPVSRRARKTA